MKFLKITISEFLHVFGLLWLIVEATSFFATEEAASSIKSYWWAFLIGGVAIVIFRLVPTKRFSFKLDGKDITIELVSGDIFKQKGPIVVGSNTTFVTNPEVISERSIQGIFTKKYFTNHQALNDTIRGQITSDRQKFGTTVTVRANKRTGYFCALADVNENGVAQSNIENIRVSLAELWNYLGSNGEKDILNVPILGSGFSRVSATREELFQEIVKSFIASTSEHTFCDGLRIVVRPSDLRKNDIDLLELASFLKYSCKYSLVESTTIGQGTAEG
jgi:hypothetical protein